MPKLELLTGTMHRLRFGTSDVKLIDPTHRPGAGPIGIDQQLGLRYLTFVVTNLDEIIQRLEAEHIAFTRPKTTIRPGTTIAMVRESRWEYCRIRRAQCMSTVSLRSLTPTWAAQLVAALRRQRRASCRHTRRSGQRRMVGRGSHPERCGHNAPAGADPVHACSRRISPVPGSASTGCRCSMRRPVQGVSGTLCASEGQGDIGFAAFPPNAASIKGHPLEQLRRATTHAALVVATRVTGNSLAPINAQYYTTPFGPPVLQVAGMHHASLADQAQAHPGAAREPLPA